MVCTKVNFVAPIVLEKDRNPSLSAADALIFPEWEKIKLNPILCSVKFVKLYMYEDINIIIGNPSNFTDSF